MSEPPAKERAPLDDVLTQVDQRDDLLRRVEPEDRPRVVGLEGARRPPVAREPAAGRPEQHRVDAARDRGQILLVGVRVAGQRCGREHEGRCPPQLHRLLVAADVVQTAPGLRPEHAESPRLGQMVVRGVQRELEQFAQRPLVEGLGTELLRGPPPANRAVYVHVG